MAQRSTATPRPHVSVSEARTLILDRLAPLGGERVGLLDAVGRVLALDVAARVDRPPADLSAMDGFALRGADLGPAPVMLRVIGAAEAGHPFAGRVGPGEAVRIATGGLVPDGADAVVPRERAAAAGVDGTVMVGRGGPEPRFLRRRGSDFRAGDVPLRAGRHLTSRDIGLVAAMAVPWLTVHRRVRVGILNTGDEVVMPGEPAGPGDLVSGTGPALHAWLTRHGALALDLGTAPDDAAALLALVDAARGCDLLVVVGGLSVGVRDLVVPALHGAGLELSVHRVAVRPGKPFLFGRLAGVPVLGLSGNTVSAMVGVLLFLDPVLRRLQGLPEDEGGEMALPVAAPLPANDEREDYLRARFLDGPDGRRVEPFPVQDSALVADLAAADALVVRPPHAEPAAAGDLVRVVPLVGRL